MRTEARLLALAWLVALVALGVVPNRSGAG
jgi:hypothetical protein